MRRAERSTVLHLLRAATWAIALVTAGCGGGSEGRPPNAAPSNASSSAPGPAADNPAAGLPTAGAAAADGIALSDDGRMKVRVPGGWQAARLPGPGKIQIRNAQQTAFLSVISEPKEDFAFKTIRDYAVAILRIDGEKKMLTDTALSAPRAFDVNGAPALQLELRGTEKNGLRLVFVKTFVATATRWNQVVCWSTPSHIEAVRADCQAVVESLVEVTGALPVPNADSVVRSQVFPRAQRCYQEAVAHGAQEQGRILLGVRIDADGSVAASAVLRNEGLSPALAACIAASPRGVRFASPAGGGATLRIPFSFRPTAADARTLSL